MSVVKTSLKFDELSANFTGRTFMLTNGANEILSSDGGGTNQGIRELDIGVFAHYDNTNGSKGVLLHKDVDITQFSVLLDSQDNSTTYDEQMNKIMIPIISKVDTVPTTSYSSNTGQVLAPRNLNIGKPSYFAGSVIKAMSNKKAPNQGVFKGVYHIKAINYNHLTRITTYPSGTPYIIEDDAVVQGYRLFVDYYIAIIRDFLNQREANTLYLAQFPGLNFGGHAIHFYSFLLCIIYSVLKLQKLPDDKIILFNINANWTDVNLEYLMDVNNFKKMLKLIPNKTEIDDKEVARLEKKDITIGIYDWFKRNNRLRILAVDGEVDRPGYFYEKIFPYIIQEVGKLFTAPVTGNKGPPGDTGDGKTPGDGPPVDGDGKTPGDGPPVDGDGKTPVIPGDGDGKTPGDGPPGPLVPPVVTGDDDGPPGPLVPPVVTGDGDGPTDSGPPGPTRYYPPLNDKHVPGSFPLDALASPQLVVTTTTRTLYMEFYDTMEQWIDDDTLEKMFSGKKIVTTDIWLNELYDKYDNKIKIKMIFDYLRNLNKPFTMGGGGTLEDFKNYIRQQISKIKISQ